MRLVQDAYRHDGRPAPKVLFARSPVEALRMGVVATQSASTVVRLVHSRRNVISPYLSAKLLQTLPRLEWNGVLRMAAEVDASGGEFEDRWAELEVLKPWGNNSYERALTRKQVRRNARWDWRNRPPMYGSRFSAWEGIAFAAAGSVVILWEKPTHGPYTISVAGRDVLHGEKRPAITYADGWSIYAWRGVTIPREVVLNPDLITAAMIQRERNMEVRRVLMERLGTETYIKAIGAECIHHDKDGLGNPRRLWRASESPEEPFVVVEVINSTPEPDGTSRHYFLRVPPTTETCQQAIAWTFGITDPDTYMPVVET